MMNIDSDTDTNHNVKNLHSKQVLPSAIRSKIPDQFKLNLNQNFPDDLDQDITVPQEQVYDQLRNMEENLRL